MRYGIRKFKRQFMKKVNYLAHLENMISQGANVINL